MNTTSSSGTAGTSGGTTAGTSSGEVQDSGPSTVTGNTDGGDGHWCPTLKACCDRFTDAAMKKNCTDAWTGVGGPANSGGADVGCKISYGAAYAGYCK